MTKMRFITLFVMNFISFWVIAFSIGGDAVSGHSVDGAYFLSMNGFDTEVSRLVYSYSMAHTLLLWLNALCFPVISLFKINLS